MHKQKIISAACRGLDFITRTQCVEHGDFNYGRFVLEYDIAGKNVVRWSDNWTTAVVVEALLMGYQITDCERYLLSAQCGVEYLKRLQYLGNDDPDLYGVFREETPVSVEAYPRDALTAAWALMDWHLLVHDEDALERSVIYADWFIAKGMKDGYPRWRVTFGSTPWEPDWFGSFHSGSAFYLGRMYELTGNQCYLDGAVSILRHYNKYHLGCDGTITVILDKKYQPLDGIAPVPPSDREWEIMHRYNDDFGTLANLLLWRIGGDISYKDAACRFLQRMIASQRFDGGFGADYSISSAAGSVAIELCAAKSMELCINTESVLDRAADYIISLQFSEPDSSADGSFCEMDSDGYMTDRMIVRTAAYGVMGLFNIAGGRSTIYTPAGILEYKDV